LHIAIPGDGLDRQNRSALAEWKAHWPLVVSAMVGFSFYTVVTYSLGTFIEPLQKQFGWNRTSISFGLSIFGIVMAIGGPPVGAVIDRIGTRWMAIIGLIASGSAFAAFSLANGSLTQWFSLWVVFSVCALMIKSTVWSAAVASVFSTGRGLALAAVLSGSAIGQSLAPLVTNALIASHGWQTAYRWIGFGWAGLGAVLVAIMFFDARDLDKRVSGSSLVSTPLPGLTVREAARDSRVIRIAVANLLMAIASSGVTVHLVPLISETGISRTGAVEIAATAGIAGIVGKFLTGWLLDRIQGNWIPVTSYAVAAVGHILLLNLLGSRTALTVAALLLGYSAGAGLQVSTYLISRYAGLRNFGTVFGTIASAMLGGTACGPLIAGYIHDKTGSYALLLMGAAPVMLLCSLLFVGLGPYPVFERRAAVQSP
jgi:MFS family permease